MGNKRPQFIPRLLPDKIAEIRELYLTGMPTVEIGKIFDRERTTILHHCKDLKPKGRRPPRKFLTKEEAKKAQIESKRFWQKKRNERDKQLKLENISAMMTRLKIKPVKTYQEYMKEDKKQNKQIQAMIKLRSEGVSIPKIAKQFNLHPDKERYILEKYGADGKFAREIKVQRERVKGELENSVPEFKFNGYRQ